jgi:hypothetical protein
VISKSCDGKKRGEIEGKRGVLILGSSVVA